MTQENKIAEAKDLICDKCNQTMGSDWYVYAVINKKGERIGNYICGVCARLPKIKTVQLLTASQMRNRGSLK